MTDRAIPYPALHAARQAAEDAVNHIRHASTVEEFVREHNGPDDPCDLDTTSSAARQHYIDTGEWPRKGETFPVEPFDGPNGYGPGTPRIVTAVAAGHEPPRYGNEAPTSNPDARAVPIDTTIDRAGVGPATREALARRGLASHVIAADDFILPAHVVRRLRLLLAERQGARATHSLRIDGIIVGILKEELL